MGGDGVSGMGGNRSSKMECEGETEMKSDGGWHGMKQCERGRCGNEWGIQNKKVAGVQ
jgi:hypothetical protein